MIVQWKIRRSTTAEWIANNPVLAEGEPGYDTVGGILKIGDGVKHWLDLGVQSYSAGTLDALLASVSASASAAQAAATAASTAVTDAQAVVTAFPTTADSTVAGLIQTPSSQIATALSGIVGSSSTTKIKAAQHNDGNSDATAYLNGLITSMNALTRGGTILLDGIYRCDSSLMAKSNVTLEFVDNNAWLRRNYTDTGGALGSLIRNFDFTVKVNNFRIIGPGRIGTDNFASQKGNAVCIYGDDMLFAHFRVDGWAGGRAFFTVGDRQRFLYVRVVNSTGQPGDGGIRIGGGNDGVAIGCHVESGDDALQLVPGGGAAATMPTLWSQTIRRFSFIGCTGFSTQGRFMIVALQNRDLSQQMNASIIDCSFIGCHGTGGTHFGFYIQNLNSTGDIDGITYTDSSTNAGGSQSASVEGFIQRAPETLATVGRIRRITLQGYKMRGPRKTSLATRGGVDYLTLKDCHFEGPTSTTVSNANLTNGSTTVTVAAQTDFEGNPLPPPFSDIDTTASITGTGIQTNTVVSSVADDGLSLVMSKAATATISSTVTVGGTWTLDLSATNHARVIGGSIQGGGNSHLLQAGAVDRVNANGSTTFGAANDLIVDGVHFYDVPDNVYGVNLNVATGANVQQCTFNGKAGETLAGGVRVGSASTKVMLTRNDLTGLSNASKRILDTTTGGQVTRSSNLGADTGTTGPAAPDVQVFATAGTFTWTKPTGAVLVEVQMIGTGGGGGAGRRGPAGAIRCGGGGGGGGQRMTVMIPASDLGATEAVTVGAGGAGAAGQTVDSTDGASGSTGAQTLFGTGTTTRVLALSGGIGGAGGTATTGTGAAALGPGIAVGQSASTTGAAPVSSFSTGRGGIGGAAGGGAGGGITAANVDSAGGAGLTSVSGSIAAGATAGAAGGGAGGTPPAIRTNARVPGASGAGGGGSSVSAGGAGSAGGIYGAGGGGGGASLNGFASGAGGNGADGLVVVTSYFV